MCGWRAAFAVAALAALLGAPRPPFASLACHWAGVACPDGRAAVRGRAAAALAPMRARFERWFATGHEHGAHVAVFRRGECVAALRGGAMADAAALVVVQSTSKVLVSLAVAMLVDRGALALDAPVARYWPAFGEAGKADVTVRELMQHRARVPALDGPLLLDEHVVGSAALERALAEQAPLLLPTNDTASFYHAVTRGLIVDALVRRADGRSLAQFIHDEITEPLGVDYFLGADEQTSSRIVEHVGVPTRAIFLQMLPQVLFPRLSALFTDPMLRLEELDHRSMRAMLSGTTNGLLQRSVFVLPSRAEQPPFGSHGMANMPAFQTSGYPSVAGITNAHALAAIGDVLARGGKPLLSTATLTKMLRADTFFDESLGEQIKWSQNGWSVDYINSTLQGWTGWYGAGGSAFVFNREHELAFAYTPSFLAPRITRPRAETLLRMVEAAFVE